MEYNPIFFSTQIYLHFFKSTGTTNKKTLQVHLFGKTNVRTKLLQCDLKIQIWIALFNMRLYILNLHRARECNFSHNFSYLSTHRPPYLCSHEFYHYSFHKNKLLNLHILRSVHTAPRADDGQKTGTYKQMNAGGVNMQFCPRASVNKCMTGSARAPFPISHQSGPIKGNVCGHDHK